MVLERLAAEGLLDLGAVGGLRHTEDLVVVLLLAPLEVQLRLAQLTAQRVCLRRAGALLAGLLKVAHRLLVGLVGQVRPRPGAQRLGIPRVELQRRGAVRDRVRVAREPCEEDRPVRVDDGQELFRLGVLVRILLGRLDDLGVLAESLVVAPRLERGAGLVLERLERLALAQEALHVRAIGVVPERVLRLRDGLGDVVVRQHHAGDEQQRVGAVGLGPVHVAGDRVRLADLPALQVHVGAQDAPGDGAGRLGHMRARLRLVQRDGRKRPVLLGAVRPVGRNVLGHAPRLLRGLCGARPLRLGALAAGGERGERLERRVRVAEAQLAARLAHERLGRRRVAVRLARLPAVRQCPLVLAERHERRGAVQQEHRGGRRLLLDRLRVLAHGGAVVAALELGVPALLRRLRGAARARLGRRARHAGCWKTRRAAPRMSRGAASC